VATIQLSDEKTALIAAKAAAQGLTVEDWLGELAARETPAAESPSRRRRYRLAELLAQSDPNAELTFEDRVWLGDAPVGRKAI
jgi:antitoxin component of MazEF toxin-antitoxin module